MAPESRPEGARESHPQIPGYKLEAVIGRGSTGVVYRARQLAVDRSVALKVLHRELAGRGQAIRRLQREARTTARLSHPTIVSAIDMGETQGLWWYAMELVEGESLAQRLRHQGRLSERESLRLFIPLCEALQHAHEHGVVHRDIKPANVLIDRDGRPHLVDLGLAVADDDPGITRHGGTLGTPHYISPEQARSPRAADIRSDIWSLGATLYHALCGRPPFVGESVAEILSGVLYARIENPLELAPDLSKGMAFVLRKCLARAPERRYQAPRELLEDLELLRERRDVRIRASTLDPMANQRDRRRWWFIGAGALAVLAATAWLLWLRPPVPDPALASSGTPRVQRPWEPLEEIAAHAAQGRRSILPAITELEQLVPVPEMHRARYDELAQSLAETYRREVGAFGEQLNLEFERLLLARDFVAARELADGGRLDADLRRTFNPSVRQLRDLHERLRDDELRTKLEGRIEQEFQRDLASFQSRLAQTVVPEVRGLTERGQWRLATAALANGASEGLRAAAARERRFPADVEQRLAREGEALTENARADLESRWRALDLELARGLEARADEIENAIQSRSFSGERGEHALREAYLQELGRVGTTEDQLLTEVSAAARETLERRAAKLAALQESLAAQDAESWARITESEAAPLWRDRDYAAARQRWEEGRGRAWTARVAQRVEAEIRWGEHLEGLLARASDVVKSQQNEKLSVLIGSIGAVGTVKNASDPLGQGFDLARGTTEGDLRLALKKLESPRAQMLSTEAIERLLGWPANEIADPNDRLLRTLFRYREGDITGAWAAYRSGPLPPRESDPVLLQELELRLARSADAQEAEREQRLRDARSLYDVIQRTAAERTDLGQLVRRIDMLLATYGDLDWVQEREAELKAQRQKLVAPRQPATSVSLQKQLGAQSLELEGGRAQIVYEFTPSYDGAWQRGDWTSDVTGWRASEPRNVADLYESERWPRLALGPPIDLDDKLELELVFDQPESSGPPRLLVVSIAGWHAALAGPQKSGERPRVLAERGDESALRNVIEQALAGKGETFEKLEHGTHRLRFLLTQRRGRFILSLDGTPLFQADIARATDRDKSASIVVRSLEPVRLRSALLEAELDR